MRMSSIDMGLDYDSMVMLTCKLQFAAAKAIVLIYHGSHKLCLLDIFFFRTKEGRRGGGGGGHWPSLYPPLV